MGSSVVVVGSSVVVDVVGARVRLGVVISSVVDSSVVDSSEVVASVVVSSLDVVESNVFVVSSEVIANSVVGVTGSAVAVSAEVTGAAMVVLEGTDVVCSVAKRVVLAEVVSSDDEGRVVAEVTVVVGVGVLLISVEV